MDKLKKNGAKIFTALMAIYFIFFMSLGTRTFAQHVIRIATTPEAKELAYEMVSTVREAGEAVSSRVRGAVGGFSNGRYSDSPRYSNSYRYSDSYRY